MSEWRFPEHVRGWLSPAEGRKLADLASGKRVLEIGSFEGRSTISMAQTALAVECVDPFDGRATPAADGGFAEGVAATSLAVFRNNLHEFGVRQKVTIRKGTTSEVAEHLDAGVYDLVFVDGDHAFPAVQIDVALALRVLAPGGLLVFHDYRRGAAGEGTDPGVELAVDELLATGAAELLERCDSLAVLKPKSRAWKPRPIVFLGLPRRGLWVGFGASRGFHLWPSQRATAVRADCHSSILDWTFNRLWATALNHVSRGVTHFAMIHDDVGPSENWLDVLIAELERTGADVCSAVVPIKTMAGLTSTAIESGDPWHPRRLTLSEVHALPPTFGDADVGGELLLNTGLWVCDLRRPFWTAPSPLVFQCLSRIVPDRDGDWEAQIKSEDWEFSRAARARGAKLVATRLVEVDHAGEALYSNATAWGDWKTDEVYRRLFPDVQPVGSP